MQHRVSLEKCKLTTHVVAQEGGPRAIFFASLEASSGGAQSGQGLFLLDHSLLDAT